MKQIITLEKEIAFKTMVGDITSISLEPDLAFINDSEIEGNLIISGTYKMTEASTIEEEFNYKIPVEIMLTTSLEEDKRKIDINNFTYDIVNEDSLNIKVELLIEGLEKIEVEEEKEEEVELLDVREENKEEEVLKTKENDPVELPSLENIKEDNTINLPKQEEVPVMNEEVTVEDKTVNIESPKENNKVIDSIFSAFANTEETYSTYSVYILREDDNLEEVMNKYNTTRDILKEYNDLDNLTVGSKLIIPTNRESND